MRYSLRTLLILMLICGLLFARIAYLRRMAAFHAMEAAKTVQRMPLFSASPDYVMQHVERYAQKRKANNVIPHGDPWNLEHEGLAKEWKLAVYHHAMANAYARAILFPPEQITVEHAYSPEKEAARFKRSQSRLGGPRRLQMPADF